MEWIVIDFGVLRSYDTHDIDDDQCPTGQDRLPASPLMMAGTPKPVLTKRQRVRHRAKQRKSQIATTKPLRSSVISEGGKEILAEASIRKQNLTCDDYANTHSETSEQERLIADSNREHTIDEVWDSEVEVSESEFLCDDGDSELELLCGECECEEDDICSHDFCMC